MRTVDGFMSVKIPRVQASSSDTTAHCRQYMQSAMDSAAVTEAEERPLHRDFMRMRDREWLAGKTFDR
jgi:hypothetical protein